MRGSLPLVVVGCALIVHVHGGSAAAQTDAPADASASADPAPEVEADVASPDAVEPAHPEEDARHAEALSRFDDATALFERGDIQGALAEMSLVYELLEDRPDQYVVFYNLGRLYEELHRYDRAVELYERYLRESPSDGEDRADAEASLRALERFLGTLAVDVDIEVEVWLGDALVGHAPGDIRVPSGAHVLEVRAEGYETFRREIELAARTRLEIHVTLAPLSDVQGISPGFFGASVALAVIAGGIGTGFGTHALSMSNGARGCVPTDACGDPATVESRIGEAALAADLLYGGAALFAVTAVVLAFVTDWDGPPGAPDSASVRLVPIAGPQAAGLAVDGAF